MEKASKVGCIMGANSYESKLLKGAIEYYTREKFDAEPCIITANEDLISEYVHLARCGEWRDDLVLALRKQVEELVDKGAKYIVAPASASKGFAYDAIFEGMEGITFLNDHQRRLSLNLIPILSGTRHGENLQFIGPTEEIDILTPTAVEEHTRNCDVLTAQVFFLNNLDHEIQKSLFTETEGDMHLRLIDGLRNWQRACGAGHLAVTDFWTERLLTGKERTTFDHDVFSLSPFETHDPYGCLPGHYNIVRPKIFNLAIIFARFVSWCSTCQANNLSRN